jgi:hypothetical protein
MEKRLPVLYSKLCLRLAFFGLWLALFGCSFPVTVPDSLLLRKPRPVIFKLDAGQAVVWEATLQVMKANGWTIGVQDAETGLIALSLTDEGVISRMSVLVKPDSENHTTIHFHCINSMITSSPDYPDIEKTIVYPELEPWGPLVNQIAKICDAKIISFR